MSCGKRKRGKRRFIHIERVSDHGFDGPFACDSDGPTGFRRGGLHGRPHMQDPQEHNPFHGMWTRARFPGKTVFTARGPKVLASGGTCRFPGCTDVSPNF